MNHPNKKTDDFWWNLKSIEDNSGISNLLKITILKNVILLY